MFIFWEKVRCPFFQILLLLNQVEVNQPVVRTVGNISTAIAQSEFGTSVQRGVQVSNFKLDYYTRLRVIIWVKLVLSK